MNFWYFKLNTLIVLNFIFWVIKRNAKKSSKLISNFLYKKNMFCLKQVCVQWVNLMNKQIISTFQRLQILNQMVELVNIHLLILIC
jgi:hypothetical protein